MKLPFVVSIPHCSGRVPDSMKGRFALSQEEIDDSVDHGTREVFGSLDAAETLFAEWSRLVVDLNRAPERRDLKGVVAGVDYFGRQVYRPGMTPGSTEIDRWLNEYYWPYHLHLRDALTRDPVRGLFDGHSLNGTGPAEAPDAGQKRKDIVLSNNGDHDGQMTPLLGAATCPVPLLHLMREVFTDAGFSVALNDPYTAGFITAHYGRNLSEKGRFAVQMEINQDLFIDLKTGKIAQEKLGTATTRIQGCFDEIARRM